MSTIVSPPVAYGSSSTTVAVRLHQAADEDARVVCREKPGGSKPHTGDAVRGGAARLPAQARAAAEPEPEAAVQRTRRCLLARLELVVPDGSVDFHYVASDAATGRVLDNERGGKVPVVEDADRHSNPAAAQVFAAPCRASPVVLFRFSIFFIFYL